MTNFGATPEQRNHTTGPRIDDQQRNETVDRLSSAVATGRLTEVEFDERAELALRARTQAELDVLVDDLLPATRRRPDNPLVTLSAADLAKVIGFVVVTGMIAWVVGGQVWPYEYGRRLLLWLFGLVCGIAGAALRGRR